jgi:SAM-dependent methyltransferase
MDPDYYENEHNVASYIKFTPARDGTLLVDALSEHLARRATVLELGMGPGRDFERLGQHFHVTGSDFSRLFLERYRRANTSADLLYLDARTLDTGRRFDAIFSNKALIHLSADELRQSFRRQHAVLNDNGLILHSFWYGEGEQAFNGLNLVYHNENDLPAMLADDFTILALNRHTKQAEGDSIYVLARKQ